MTAPSQPQPYPGDAIAASPGTVHHRREYRDAAGRPMTGKVSFTGTARTEAGDVVVVPAPIPVDVVGGVLDVWLQPDTYTVAAELRTAEGVKVTDRETVTLELE